MASVGVTIPFGKWKGIPLQDVETGYLEWMLSVLMKEHLKQAIQEELLRRKRPETQGQTLEDLRELITRGRKVLAREHHPDKDGSADVMKGINVLADWLIKERSNGGKRRA